MPPNGIYLSNERYQQLNGDLFEQDSRGVIADTFQQQATAALPDLVAEAQRQAEQQAQAQRDQMADQFMASVQADPGLAAHLGGASAPQETPQTAPILDSGPSNAAPANDGGPTPGGASGWGGGESVAPPQPSQTPPAPAAPAPTAPVTASMSPASGWETVARAAAQKYGIDPDIFARQIGQESGFNPAARSPAGAIGIAQFMPATAQGMGIDPTDPQQALDGAARLMAGHLQTYGGDYSKALAAYNAGPGNVDKYGGIPPFAETQQYVSNILGGVKQAAAGAVQAVQTAVRDPGSILEAVKPFLGQAYVWGGKGPQQGGGFDCSGLAGFLTTGQPESTVTLYGKSSAIGQDQAQPGDLVFWNMGTSDPHLQHVGVYLGNGQIVQSGGNQARVNIGSVDQAIGSPPEFRRLGPGGAPAQAAVAPAQTGMADQTAASTSAPQGILDRLQQIGPTIGSAISDAFSNLFGNLNSGAGVLAQGQEAQGRGLTQMGQGVGQFLTEPQPWLQNVAGTSTKQLQADVGISPYEPGQQQLTPTEQYAQARGIETALAQTLVPEELIARGATTGAGSLARSAQEAATFARGESGELRFPGENPFVLHTEPGPGRVPLGEDDIASHVENLGAQYEANVARIQELENRISGGTLKTGASGIDRPPWAVGINNEALRQIAEDHGYSAETPGWWQKAGLFSGSGEVRENVGQGGYTGLGRTQQTPAQARTELQRLIAENDQIMAATELPEGVTTLYRATPQTAEELPWSAYTQPAEVATNAPTGIPAQAVSAGADQGSAGAYSTAAQSRTGTAAPAPAAEVAQPLSLTPVTAQRAAPQPPPGEPHGLTINLPKYVPDEVRGIIQQAYDAHPEIMDAARRGVIPDDVVRDLAAQTGTNAGRIANLWKPGQAKNAETILALRQSLADQSQQVLTAQQAVRADPTKFDAQQQLVQALTRHAAVQEVVTGVTAEAGRALRQFRQPIEGANQTIESLQQLAKRWKVSPEEFGAAIAKVDLSDPVAVAGVARSLVHHTPADYLSALWYFNLLSSPLSHVRNIVSNSVVAAIAPLESAPAAAMDIVRTAITGAPRERFFGELGAQYVGFGGGMREGMVNGLQILAHGYSDAQAAGQLAGTGAAREVFSGPLGAVINAPGRALGAEDAFFRTMNKTGSLYAQAYRIASQEGLKGQALIDRVTELRRAPLPDMLKEAESVGAFRIFQEDSELAKKLSQLPGWTRFFVPFIKTPINITKYVMQYSPVGFGTIGYDATRGVAGTAGQIEDRLARASMGTAILGGLSLWAQDGNLTGPTPDTPTERDAFLREHPAYSMKIGNEWYSYQALQPFSSLFAAVAAIHQSQEKGMRLEPAAAGTLVAFAVAKSITDMPWLQGLTQALDAQHNPQQMAGAYTEQVARSLAFPTAFWGWVNRATDNMLRSPQNPGQAFVSQFPGLTGASPSRLNAFGQEVQRPPEQMGILGSLNPFNPAPVKDDPVDKALADLQMHGYTVEPGFVGKQQTVPKLGVAVELTNDETRQVQKVSGQLAYSILLPVVTNPAWGKLTPEARAKIVDDVISKSRDYARKQLLPELIPRGIQAFNQEYATGIRKPAPKPAGVP